MKKIIIITGVIFAFAFSISTIHYKGYKIGDVATDFLLKGVDGKEHSLASINDAKGYVVIFTCNHCPYSVAYEDRIIALQNKYGPKGYPVVAINPNDADLYPSDGFDKMKERAKEKNFTFLYLHDEKQEVYPLYGASKTPHVFLLDNKRVVKYIGAIDDSTDPESVEQMYLSNAIDALINGQEPSPNVTKAIGCSIKTKKK